MDRNFVRNALAGTLESEARSWLKRWVEENPSLVLTLPVAEGNAVLSGPRTLTYGNLEPGGPALLVSGLRRLEFGDSSGVPSCRVLTCLNAYLLKTINEPDALQ